MQFTLCDSQGDLGEIALQSPQDRLGFRITETNVIFQDFRTVRSQHQTEIEHAAEWKSLDSRGLQSGFDYLFLDEPFGRSIEQSRSREGSHSSGVGPLIIIERPFVVLRDRHCRVALAIAENQIRNFAAGQTFLEHQPGPRFAQLPVYE